MSRHRPPPLVHNLRGASSYSQGAPRWQELISVCDRLDATLIAAGYPAANLGRIAAYRRLLIQHLPKGDSPLLLPEGESMPTVMRALAELQELDVIVTQLAHRQEWHDALGKLVSGRFEPGDDRNPKARSTQFELWLAARFIEARLAVRPAEPDLHVTWDGWTFAVAAKRLRSDQQYETRVNEACDQINASKLPGIVAIDLSELFPFTHKPTYVNTLDGSVIVGQKLLQEFSVTHRIKSMPLPRHSLPFGLLLSVMIPVGIAGLNAPQIGHSMTLSNLVIHDDARARRLVDLQRRLLSAQKNVKKMEVGGSVTYAAPTRKPRS